jgi:hypothetical protein
MELHTLTGEEALFLLWAVPEVVRKFARYSVTTGDLIPAGMVSPDPIGIDATLYADFRLEMAKWDSQRGYHSTIVEVLSMFGYGWEFKTEDRNWHYVSKRHGYEPRVGDKFSRICAGWEKPLRGMLFTRYEGPHSDPNRGVDHLLWYRTSEEQSLFDENQKRRLKDEKRSRYEQKDPKLAGMYAALPLIFQMRIDKFRANNPDFKEDFEAYELFVCTEAVKLVKHFENARAISTYQDMPKDSRRQLEILAKGHNDNTITQACHLARFSILNPQAIVNTLHGSLSHIVGCAEYGCSHTVD